MLTPAVLFLYGLIACGTVLARVLIGTMPLYFVDILAVVIIILGRKHIGIMFARHRKISVVTVLFLLSLLPTTFAEYFRMGFMEPTYLLIRSWLHVIALWPLAGLLRNPLYLRRFLFGIVTGCLITAIVATLNSLPVTGPWVRAHIFTIDLLFPQRGLDIDVNLIMALDEAQAERGNSLLGKSNVTGGVLIVMLPFLVGMLANLRLNHLMRTALNIAIVITLIGLLSTYSRLTYLAIVLVFIGYYLYDRREFARRFVPVVTILAIGILYVGVQSTLFKFEFLIDKFDLTNEQYEGTNMARLLSYTRPFELIISNPSYLFRGAGRAHFKLREQQRDANILVLKDNEMHSVLAASIFWRGFISTFLLFYLCYLLIRLSYRSMKMAKRQRLADGWLVTSGFISLMGLSMPWLLEHYFVSKPSAHMFLFMYFSLLLACNEAVIAAEKDSASPGAAAGKPAKTGGVMKFPSRPLRH